jgi:predicted transport protein
MPLFYGNGGNLTLVPQIDFALESELQLLIESNLNEVFGCRLISTEFSTGTAHAGRIDSLAISEDNNPVIIEYKKVESSELVNQSLYYLDWILDHKGDFEIAATKALGADVDVDWSHVRVICVAPSYNKFALHAVKQIAGGIELWQYHRYANGCLELEEVFQSNNQLRSKLPSTKKRSKPILNAYNYDQHEAKLNPNLGSLAADLREYLLGLNPSIAEVPVKLYVAYKLAKNVACVEFQKKRLMVFVTLDLSSVDLPSIAKDMTNTGHFGTGNVEISITSREDLEIAQDLIRKAYLRGGGD